MPGLCWALALTLPLLAQDAGRWAKQGSSLLHYDSSGTLVSEIGLGVSEETASHGLTVTELLGNAAPGGRLAWVIEKRVLWNASRTKQLKAEASLKVLGSSGRELWTEAAAAIPESGDPVPLGPEGESLALSLKKADGYWLSVRGYLGNTLFETGPFPRLVATALSPSGRYALARWTDPDKSATHTFLDVTAKRREDIPSERFLAPARMEEQRLYSGSKVIFEFATETEKKKAP